MNKPLNFSVIGGDKRQLHIASLLLSEGHHVRIFGYGGEARHIGNIKASDSASDCVKGSDAVILPMPYNSSGGAVINTPLSAAAIDTEDLVSEISKSTRLFAGKADAYLRELCRRADISLTDYSEREELAVMNSVPTAEGAIELAMNNTPYTIRDSRCLVIGYGRIGKILSADLKALGADVTATARKHSDLAWISASGYTAVPTSNVSSVAEQFDIIFNTVPHRILDFKALSATKKDVLIIDLASHPGGVDFDVARELNRRVIHALSLPGKVAPYTAGKIIKDTIINILEEMEV